MRCAYSSRARPTIINVESAFALRSFEVSKSELPVGRIYRPMAASRWTRQTCCRLRSGKAPVIIRTYEQYGTSQAPAQGKKRGSDPDAGHYAHSPGGSQPGQT